MPQERSDRWRALGPVDELKAKPLRQVVIDKVAIALSYRDGRFGAISGRCNHAGGPLGDGVLRDDGFIVCPWHHWMFHRETGEARPGIPAIVPRHDLKEESGVLYVNLEAATKRVQAPHPPHPLSRKEERKPGPVRLLGLSTTAMDEAFPRYSTSDDLLGVALEHGKAAGAETRMLRLSSLKFRHCEGYYSKSSHACTWPCSITQMDSKDELTEVYEHLVFWADAVLVATPIRWGGPSSLYIKMVERLNSLQNQITLHDRVMIKNKTAGFIITGGQDNVQAVAGQMMMFFGELGFHLPPFPFVAHTRGWSAEDMENNRAAVQSDAHLRESAGDLAHRCVEEAARLLGQSVAG
jgi:nitrite reductase/ring-hydroxylating ferredoxin subunit/multimeric flavodoxin WrbA